MAICSARTITGILRKAGFTGFTTAREAEGLFRCTQRYAVRGALTPGDMRSRREARARAAAETLTQAGFIADYVDDRVRVRCADTHEEQI